MQCSIDRLFEYFRGELDDLEMARMLDHVDACKPCWEDFNSLKLIYVKKAAVLSGSEHK